MLQSTGSQRVGQDRVLELMYKMVIRPRNGDGPGTWI